MDERSFIEGLLDEVGLQLEPQTHQELLTELDAQLKQLFVLNLLDKLPQAAFDAFEDFMRDDPPQQGVIDYLHGHVPESDLLLADSRATFREQFLATQKR